MKITCQACAAKYTIADEKVVGKTVKIRCKKCGANILVNAGEGVGGATGPAVADSRLVSSDLAGSGGSGDRWMVNVGETDQRTMTIAEIAAEYRAVVTDDTFCWKEGMEDWLPLRDIPELYAACSTSGGGSRSEAEDAGAPRNEGASAAAGSGNGSAAAALAAPVARRAAAARAPSADLFGKAAQAGGEDDVLTSAPAGAPQRREREHEEEAKPIGARNENSVLFSLGALTAPAAMGSGAAESKTTATGEASGLIDIRQLSAQLAASEDNKKQSRVEDIMNLGGGALGPALAAPILSAPPLEEFVGAAAAGRWSNAPGKNRGIVFLALGIGAVLIAGVLGLTAFLMSKNPADKTQTAASGSAVAAPPEAHANAASAPNASVAAAPPVASSASAMAVPTSTETPDRNLAPSSASNESAGSKEAANTPPTETRAEHVEKETATQEKKLATTTPGAAAPAAGPFDMTEARTRLVAIAGAVQSCKRGDVSGTGHVVVTFATTGAAVTASINGPPFEGTPTGACVASKFRGARVPAFSGAPFTVTKSFTIN